MRKNKKGRKLSMKTGPRKALLQSVARSLILKERITTTEARAKEVSPLVEKLITKAKKGDLAARREILKSMSPEVTKKMIDVVAVKYKDRAGGYTRILKMGARQSDGARMAVIELV